MEKGLIWLILILVLVGVVSAIEFQFVQNPQTGKGDIVRTINQSGQNWTFNIINATINCDNIDGGTDSDFCADANDGSGGGAANFTDVIHNTVGIGTSSPQTNFKLDVQGNTTLGGFVTINGDIIAEGIASVFSGTSDGWEDDGTVVRLVTASDNVGIGTTTPQEKLDVQGNSNLNGTIFTSGDLIVS